jgi:hypothetical protein
MMTGLMGIGKSYIARGAVHFLKERKHFQHAIVWLSLPERNITKVSELA